MKFTTLLLTFLLGATVALAQGTPAPAGLPAMVEKFNGTYEGTAKGQPVSLDLKTKDGKFEGRLRNGEKSYDLTEGAVAGDGKLSLSFGKDAKLNGKVEGDKLVGEMVVGAEKTPIELKKAGSAAPAPAAASSAATPAASSTAAAPSSTAAPAFNLNGEWEGMADANGQPFPFLLTLKVDGETVTGNSSSQLGEATVKSGTWKDGRLSFQLEGTNGIIAMSATVIDGKLSGEFDYAGQLQGKWVAVKKNQ
ncbi:MAG TPA: hypothetical protein VGW58_04565 [Pyrinomonadaceae bacterium]|nr:hypothetical protein [Pyrinomonadaceae bacterium]